MELIGKKYIVEIAFYIIINLLIIKIIYLDNKS